MQLEFDPGFDVRVAPDELAFVYGDGVFGPEPELRRLHAIQPSLLDPNCTGPDPVYGIAMDIGRKEDLPELEKRMLLFGAVVYAGGSLGAEPVRSQGHVHAIAAHSGWSPPEIFEIWSGTAIIYMQERAEDRPGRCFAVTARPGDHVVVAPGWAHCVINAVRHQRMVFGAWCDRQFGFDYRGVRAHCGLAWFPTFNMADQIEWTANLRYEESMLEQRAARTYPELGLNSRSLYRQFIDNPECVMFVPEPMRAAPQWQSFMP
jgi:glucose-6-phosphate isomerase